VIQLKSSDVNDEIHMSLSILLVEDNLADVELLQSSLTDWGGIEWCLTHVQRLSEGTAYLQANCFDVVLSNLNLPDAQGLDIVSRLHSSAPDVPIIVLTDIDSEVLGVAALRRGAQDYLVKGQIDYHLLKRAIRYAVERSRTQRVMQQQVMAMASCQEGIAIFNPKEEHIYVNQAYANIFGYRTPSELIGKPWQFLYHTVQQQQIEQEVMPSLHRQGNWRGETVGQRGDGRLFDLALSLTLLENGGMVCAVSDITQRKQAERELQENIERFRNCFELPLIGVAITGADKRWIEVNDTTCNMLGYSQQELMQMTWAELTHPEDLALDLEYFTQLSSGQIDQYAMDKRYIRKDGSIIYAHLGVGSVRKADGSLDYAVALMQDVTERKQAETELRHTKEFLESVLDNAPIGVVVKDSKTLRFTLWNPAATELLGFSTAEVIGKTDYDLFSQEEADSFRAADQEVLATGKVLDSPAERIHTKDGTAKILHTVKTRVCGKDGIPQHLLAFTEDITQKKLAEEVLQQSEEKFRQLAENIQEVFFLLSADGQQVLYISPTYERIWGMPCQSYYENPEAWLAQVHPEDYDRVALAFQQQNQNQAVYNEEYRIIRPDGSMRWIWSRTYFLFDEAGNPYRIAGIAEDITERKQSEEALRQSEARFQKLASNVPGMLYQYVQHGDGTEAITFASQGCQTLYEVTPEAVQQDVNLLWNMVCPDDVPAMLEKLQAATERLEPLVMEFRIKTPSGRLKWLRGISRPERLADGSILWDGIVLDISDRKQAEEEILKALTREKELNELKSSFVSLVSHEFRTPLATILSSAELLQKYGYQWTEERKQIQFERIIAGVDRMTQLLNDVLVISRAESGKLQFNPVHLNIVEFCHDLVRELTTHLKAENHIQFIQHGTCNRISVDVQLLRHILTNIISNAIKYSSKESIVNVELFCCDDEVVFQIQDSGIGIPQSDQNKLFDSFHRGSNVGTIPGTGLGLSIVKQCVDLHQGKIEVQSQLGQGTRFTVTLPSLPNPTHE
jgi:PAS domain S-box-containing protein